MSQTEKLQQSREIIRQHISDFPHLMEDEPQSWWHSTAKILLSFRQELIKQEASDIRDYFLSQTNTLLSTLRNQSRLEPKTPEEIVSLADHLIMSYSMEIAAPFEQKEFPVETHFLPINELVNQIPDRFQIESLFLNDEECLVLHVKHPTKDFWQSIPLPKHHHVWHKGGPARAVLDIVANAPLSMQQSEFPWNDFDALVGDKISDKKAALDIGVDADGIEYMGSSQLDFPRYCAGRDTTQNQVCLGADGLYFSSEAYNTAVTGHTRIENEYVANKAIYGFDKMIVAGENLAKPRGLMRLVKAVVEDKVLSFEHLPLNANVDMGVNILFLSKKWSKKDHFSERLQKLYCVLSQMGQVRPQEKNIFDVLHRAHREHPFFDFQSEVRSQLEVVRWKSRKLVKQIDREMGWRFHIPSDLNVTRKPGDNLPQRISLEQFQLDPQQLDIDQAWTKLLKIAQRRVKKHQSQNLSTYEKIFLVGQSPVNIDYDTPEDLTFQDEGF